MSIYTFALIVLTAVLHAIGLGGAYDLIGLYDSIVHAMGGAMSAAILFDAWKFWFGFRPHWAVILLGVLVIGLLWEVHEYILDLYMPLPGNSFRQVHVADTILDLIMDELGAVMILYVLRAFTKTPISSPTSK